MDDKKLQYANDLKKQINTTQDYIKYTIDGKVSLSFKSNRESISGTGLDLFFLYVNHPEKESRIREAIAHVLESVLKELVMEYNLL
jgi:hypothetical protein